MLWDSSSIVGVVGDSARGATDDASVVGYERVIIIHHVSLIQTIIASIGQVLVEELLCTRRRHIRHSPIAASHVITMKGVIILMPVGR